MQRTATTTHTPARRPPVDGINGHVSHIIGIDYPQYQNWEEAIRRGAPESRDDIARYMTAPDPLSSATGRIGIRLINFKRSIPNDAYALAWAESNKMRPASPWLVLAMGEQQPEMLRYLNQTSMFISPLLDLEYRGERRIPYLVIRRSGREMRLAHPNVMCSSSVWFAFLKK